MSATKPTYDLVLLLDPQAEPGARAKIIDDARAAISADGEITNDTGWGDRSLAYPINHKKDAEYHLLQFHARTPELLRGLDRTLRITDGVLRFRIVKLEPGTPAAPDMRAGAHTGRHAESHGVANPDAGPAEPAQSSEAVASGPPADGPPAGGPAADGPAGETPDAEPA